MFMTGSHVSPNPQGPGVPQASWSSVRGWFKLLLHPSYSRVCHLNYLHLNCVQVPRCWYRGAAEVVSEGRCQELPCAGDSWFQPFLQWTHCRRRLNPPASWWCLWESIFKKGQKMWGGRSNRETLLWTDHNIHPFALLRAGREQGVLEWRNEAESGKFRWWMEGGVL